MHLEEFEKATKYKLDFDTVNLEFRDKYKKFLESDRIYTPVRNGKSVKIEMKGMKPN